MSVVVVVCLSLAKLYISLWTIIKCLFRVGKIADGGGYGGTVYGDDEIIAKNDVLHSMAENEPEESLRSEASLLETSGESNINFHDDSGQELGPHFLLLGDLGFRFSRRTTE